MSTQHRAQYNSEMEAESAGRRRAWTMEDIEELAQAEANFCGEGNLNQLLRDLSGRSLEAVKGRRKNPEYKARVSTLKAQIDAIVQPEPAYIASPQDLLGNTTSDDESFISANTSIGDTGNEQDTVRSHILTIGAGNISQECKDLIESLDESDIRERLEIWLAGIIRKLNLRTRRPNRRAVPQQINNNILSSRRLRSLAYKKAQLAFSKNRKQFADQLFDGTWMTDSTIRPTNTTIESGYTEIFSSWPQADEEEIYDQRAEVSYVYRAIVEEDVRNAIRGSKSSAPGPDGLTLKNMTAIPIKEIELLFNLMIYLQYTPNSLRSSRTILLPKTKDNLDQLKNYRPITISSILLRTCNRILSKRMQEIPLNASQKGFSKIDGCFANNLILHTILKQCREKIQPYNIIALDLQKAFDSVSMHSIQRALNRLNIDQKTSRYIASNYTDYRTTISCDGRNVCTLPVRKGVKQGDPLSPFLFNAVIDELLCELDKKTGIKVGEQSLAAMAYADDLLILANSSEQAKRLLVLCCAFFEKRGLKVNTSKCFSLSTDVVPSKKKLFTRSTSTFKVDGQSIKAVNTEQTLSYLGLKFATDGATKCSTHALNKLLLIVGRAPLKPQQKMELLRYHLVPRYISFFQNPTITNNTLREADRLIRTAVKHILHLPRTCHNSIFYAPIKKGGQGLFNFRDSIPLIMRNRWDRLANRDAVLDVALELSNTWMTRIRALIKPGMESKVQTKHHHASALEQSYSGNGVTQMEHNQACSAYLTNPPVYWSGEDFIRAVQLRHNLLPTVGIPSNPVSQRRCRAGCAKSESLSHVLQQCPLTHWQRIQRHDFVAKRLHKAARSTGWSAVVEPHIRGQDGILKKPDLLFIKDNTLIISDVAVHWEGPRSLTVGYDEKVAIYSTTPFIEEVKRIYPGKDIKILPYILGARGAWCHKNNEIVNHLGLSNSAARDLVTTVLRGGWMIHRHFMKAIWRTRPRA